jgi:hypothetical protein
MVRPGDRITKGQGIWEADMPTALERLVEDLRVLETRAAVEQIELDELREKHPDKYGEIRVKSDELAATNKQIAEKKEEINVAKNGPKKDGPKSPPKSDPPKMR